MLTRSISRTNVLIAAAGGMIGSGWLFSPFISAQIAGPHALISWAIAAFFMLFIALPLCELGAMFPVSGGMTNYPSFTHGKNVGFLFAWTSWLSYVVMTPIEIQAILQYSSYFFPSIVSGHDGFSLSPFGYVCAVSIMVAVVVLNSFGIKLLAECNKFASIIKFIVPMLTTCALISAAPSFSNLQFHLESKSTWSAIFSALSVGGVAFAFTGFQNGLMLAGEVQHPQRDIPIAILGAVLIGFVIYFSLQFSFLVAVPEQYLKLGWAHLGFPGEHGPLVGLTLLLGLSWVSAFLLFDAAFSPFGTTLVYTAATSRILYGMSINQHLPAVFLKENRYKIPYVALWVNCIVGACSFLPFPGWQKMVAFLSSCSILSYGIGPVCLLAMRQLQATRIRPFKLSYSQPICYFAFYACNLMLYWCGFDIIWKLMLALFVGFIFNLVCRASRYGKIYDCHPECDEGFPASARGSFSLAAFGEEMTGALYWFWLYMGGLCLISYLGEFGGIGWLSFPMDLLVIFPFSSIMLFLSTRVLMSLPEHDAVMQGEAISELKGLN